MWWSPVYRDPLPLTTLTYNNPALSQRCVITIDHVPANRLTCQRPSLSDYGFPELTAEELAAFDAAILAAETVEEERKTAWTAVSENPLVGNSSSGPAVEIEIECNADDIAGRQTPPNGDAVPQAGPSNDGVPSSINEPSRFKATNFYHYKLHPCGLYAP